MEFTANDTIMEFTANDTIMKFTTNETILAFIIIVAVIAIVYGINIAASTFPRKSSVKKMYKHAIDIDKYYYYYERGTEYWKLFMVHTGFSNAIKIIGSATTFITVYCVIDKNEFILLFLLVSAMCQVITLMVPIDKFIKTYVEAARIMQYELLAEHENETVRRKKLREAFIEAEEHIGNNLV